jgi:SagB-type dehydrogenase family enzyme
MEKIALPQPTLSGGKPLMDTLRNRHSWRNFTSQPLTPQQLADLLWAAFGFNRPDARKRTAPSANNVQEMKIFVILAEGTYVYDPAANYLDPILPDDLRKKSSTQPDLRKAPVHMVFMADYKGKKADDETKARFQLFSHVHAGFIGQNVYLYCASAGLGTCFVARFDNDGLAKALNLEADQFLLYTQVVGFPAE